MTSEEIIKVAELAWKILDPYVARSLSESEQQEILDEYYNKYGMKESDIFDSWNDLAERMR